MLINLSIHTGTRTDVHDSPDDDDRSNFFPSFDPHVTHILQTFLNIQTEDSDIICDALRFTGITTWSEFRFLKADIISCLQYEDNGRRQSISPAHVFCLQPIAGYMTHLNRTIGPRASRDFTNYDSNDYVVFRSEYRHNLNTCWFPQRRSCSRRCGVERNWRSCLERYDCLRRYEIDCGVWGVRLIACGVTKLIAAFGAFA